MNFPPPNGWHFNAREHNGHQQIQMGYQGWCPKPVDMGMNTRFDCRPHQPRYFGPNMTENRFIAPGPVRQQFPQAPFQQFNRPPRIGPPGNGPPRHGPPGNGPPRHGPPGNGPPRHGPPGNGPPRHGPPGNGSPVRVQLGQPGFSQAPRHSQPWQRFPHGQPGGNNKNKNKKKVNKRDLPENNKYYCDTCDRGYKDDDKFQAHVNTHEKCPVEGCVYVAAGKLVQLHISLQHRSGLAKKIWSLESEEDINKWREERRKKFPTTEQVAQKKAELADKLARGEVIEEKYFGKMRRRGDNRHGRGGNHGRGRGRDGHKSHGEMDHNSEHKRKCPETETECSKDKRLKTGVSEDVELANDLLSIFFGDAEASGDDDGDDDKNDSDIKKQSPETSTVTEADARVDLITTNADTLDTIKTNGDKIMADGNSLPEVNGHEECVEKSSPQVNGHQNNNALSPQGTGNQKTSYNNRNHKMRGKKKNKDKSALTPPGIDKSLLEKDVINPSLWKGQPRELIDEPMLSLLEQPFYNRMSFLLSTTAVGYGPNFFECKHLMFQMRRNPMPAFLLIEEDPRSPHGHLNTC